MKIFVSPNCCDEQRLVRSIVIRFHLDDDWDGETFIPHWGLRVNLEKDYFYGMDKKTRDLVYKSRPSFCPYCGSRLPAIERRNIGSIPIFVPTNEYYDYCATCKERAMGCICLPPQFAWQPVGGDNLNEEAIKRLEQERLDRERK